MELKRIFKPASGGGTPTEVDHVRILSESKNGRWHVSQRLIDKGVSEGWMSLSAGKITLKTAEGQPDVVYKIAQKPGYYCVYDGKECGSAKEAETHAAMCKSKGMTLATLTSDGLVPEGATQEMIDQINNPAGYAKFNHFVCQRVN